MRLLLTALVPLAFAAACGESGYQPEDGTMPAPGGIEPGEGAGQVTGTQQEREPEIVADEIEGVWVVSESRGDPAVMYGPEDSEAVVSFICRSSPVEGEADALVVQWAIDPGMAGDTVDFFTSAGNGSMVVVPLETDTPMVGGQVDASSNLATTLSNASGDIRLRTGETAVIFPTTEDLEVLIDDCRPERPEPEEPAEDAETEDEEATED